MNDAERSMTESQSLRTRVAIVATWLLLLGGIGAAIVWRSLWLWFAIPLAVSVVRAAIRPPLLAPTDREILPTAIWLLLCAVIIWFIPASAREPVAYVFFAPLLAWAALRDYRLFRSAPSIDHGSARQ
jgi:hypothetical protein